MSRTHVFILSSAISLLLFVLELVRRRRLREEYSWLWLLTSFSYLILALSPLIYGWIADLIGATNDALAFSFLGIYFLIFISVQFSVQISRLSTQNKDLAQHIAILDSEVRRLAQLPEANGRHCCPSYADCENHNGNRTDTSSAGTVPLPDHRQAHLS